MNFVEEFKRCTPWLEAALAYSGDTHEIQDVFEAVVKGDMQFWSNDRCAVVTEIITYPRKRVFHIFLAGGELSAIRELEAGAVEWAKQYGCTDIRLSGRKGWLKALQNDGWELKFTTMSKRI